MRNCNLCPRLCNAPRDGNTACGAGETPMVARAALHFWEEPPISGARGSGAVFFSGCPLSCVYCQNREISLGRFGKAQGPEQLRKIYADLIGAGAHNINLVTAGHFIPAVAESLNPKPPVPVVWNSGGYERPESLRALRGLVDIWLPDMKYMDRAAAARYSGAPDYPERAAAAIREMYDQAGDCEFGEDGLLKRGVIVRHLVLPGNIRNTQMVIEWFAEFAKGKKALFSLMSQYVPVEPPKGFPELGRRISGEEWRAASGYLEMCGVTEGYIQEPESADSAYIPPFDLTGTY